MEKVIEVQCPKCKFKITAKIPNRGYACGDCSQTPDIPNAYTVLMVPTDLRRGKRLRRRGLIIF